MSAYPPDVALAALTHGVRFCVCDLETTTSESGDRVVSVGIVQVNGRGKELAPPVYWLCDPGCKIENTRIHGIKDSDVVKEQPFSVRLDELEALLAPSREGEQVVLVAHNAGFDVGVLQLEHKRSGRTLADVSVLDTMKLARHLKIAAGGFRLSQLLAHFGLSLTSAHNALADASDTALLLRHLLEQAARGGEVELQALLGAVQGERLRSANYSARAATRSTRALKRSPFVFIERPQSHSKTHKRLPHNPTQVQLAEWLSGLRECFSLRCPLLMDRARTLRSGKVRPERGAILEELLRELDSQVVFGSRVEANAILGVLGEIARGHVRTTEVPAFYDRVASIVGPNPPRCDEGASAPYDACPECRSGRACPADTWSQPFAVAFCGLRLGPRQVGLWMGESGRLAEQAAAGRTALAAHASWLVVNAADGKRPDDADVVAALAEELGLIEPRLFLRRARALAGAGELEQAIETATIGLAARDGSSDLAWQELLRYRDALAARQHALRRVHPPRPFRIGRSAPARRPQRRRFTNVQILRS
jgi:DNA polymerase III epsilon subunit-like protein